MRFASIELLLGVLGVIAVIIAFPATLIRARRAADLSGRVPLPLLLGALGLGVLLVASVSVIVLAVALG